MTIVLDEKWQKMCKQVKQAFQKNEKNFFNSYNYGRIQMYYCRLNIFYRYYVNAKEERLFSMIVCWMRWSSVRSENTLISLRYQGYKGTSSCILPYTFSCSNSTHGLLGYINLMVGTSINVINVVLFTSVDLN